MSERGEFSKLGILLAPFVRRDAFDVLENISGRVDWPDANEQMDVIGLDGQVFDLPAMLGTPGVDEFATVLGHISHQDGFSSFRAPDQVVNDPIRCTRCSSR